MTDFEFDKKKSVANKAKHGIDFVEGQALWSDERRLEIAARTEDEPRFMLIGVIEDEHWSAVFTPRGLKIRLISIRPSRDSEVKAYEG
jgi:uncharacterized DUF497 family protein